MATRERFRWAAPIAFVLTVAALGAAFPPFSIPGYWQNVRVLIDTAAQWEVGDPSLRLWVSLFVAAANITAFAAYMQIQLAEAHGPSRLGEMAGLGLVALFMVRIALNRADLEHIAMGVWMPMLMALGAAGREERGRVALQVGAAGVLAGGAIFLWKWHTVAIALTCAAIALAAFQHRFRRAASATFHGMVAAAFAVLAYITLDVYQAGLYGWWLTLADPPRDEEVVFPGVRWSAAQLRADDVPCVLDLANNGVIAALVGRPACSRFALPIYASARYENELIAALAAKHPKTIVYSTIYWSYAVDDIDMRTRFPVLDAFIRSRYPHERCEAGYCVRSMG